MVNLRALLFCLLTLCTLTAVAESKVDMIDASETYFVPRHESMIEAEHNALIRARLNALQDKYGSVTGSVGGVKITNNNGESTTYAVRSITDNLRGEWLGDATKPAFKYYLEGNQVVIGVKFKIRARELKRNPVNFKYTLLDKAGTAKTTFESDEDIRMRFQSPRDGYIAVFLMDENNQVDRFLPYVDSCDGRYPVKKNTTYLLFEDSDHAYHSCPQETPRGIQLFTREPFVFNTLVTIFSPTPFVIPNSSANKGGIDTMTWEEFQAWLQRLEAYDNEVEVSKFDIRINGE